MELKGRWSVRYDGRRDWGGLEANKKTVDKYRRNTARTNTPIFRGVSVHDVILGVSVQ